MVLDLVQGRRTSLRELLGKLVRQGNKLDTLKGAGVGVRTTVSSIELSPAIEQFLNQEPAIETLVVNVSGVTLPALGVAGIVENFDQAVSGADEDTEILKRRLLSVTVPEAQDAGKIVILAEELKPDQVGIAWVGGTCVCILRRWFATRMLNRADVYAGQTYALASVQGSLEILWEQEQASGGLPVNVDHLAVVRFRSWDPFLWQNSGSSSAAFGTAVVPEGSGIVNAKVSAQQPEDDSACSVYVVVGGEVSPGETGRVVFAGSDPFLARIDESVLPDTDSLGTGSGASLFIKDQVGFRALADLGLHGADNWAILHAHYPFLRQIPRGTYIDENDPDTPKWPASPRVQFNFPVDGLDREAIFEFPHRFTQVQAIFCPGAVARIQASGAFGIPSIEYEFALITEQFDITQVTWNTLPASQLFGGALTQNVSATCDEGGDKSAQSSFGSGDTPRFGRVLSAAVTGEFYGFYLRGKSISGVAGSLLCSIAMAAFTGSEAALVAHGLDPC